MNHFQQYLAEEFAEDYQEGRLSRRQALKLIASITGSLLLAELFLAACSPAPDEATATTAATDPPAAATHTQAQGQPPTSPPASPAATHTAAPAEPAGEATPTPPDADTPTPPPAGTVAPDDPAVQAQAVEFPGEGASLFGYLAVPAAGAGPYPVVLVCHENRGLTAHIQDVTRRLAKAGFVALAVDLLSRQGGSAAVGEGGAPGALSNLTPEQYGQDFRSGWEYTQTLPQADAERLGMMGFCFGGGVTWQVATMMPELRAAVPYYGPHPPLKQVPGIQAAVLGIYGELDGRINGGIPAIEAAMQANGKTFQKIIYAGADHAFNNDTGSRYNASVAADAWAQTLAWFGQHL
jgi:carboxymethylenebutenolidase